MADAQMTSITTNNVAHWETAININQPIIEDIYKFKTENQYLDKEIWLKLSLTSLNIPVSNTDFTVNMISSQSATSGGLIVNNANYRTININNVNTSNNIFPNSNVIITAKAASADVSPTTNTIIENGLWKNTSLTGPTNGQEVYYGRVEANIPAITPIFTGGTVSLNSTSINTTNCTVVESSPPNAALISITPIINRAAVTYNSAISGWITISSANLTALAAASQVQLAQKDIYVTSVRLQPPSSGSHTFQIIVPNGGNSTMTFTFSVDSLGNTVVI